MPPGEDKPNAYCFKQRLMEAKIPSRISSLMIVGVKLRIKVTSRSNNQNADQKALRCVFQDFTTKCARGKLGSVLPRQRSVFFIESEREKSAALVDLFVINITSNGTSTSRATLVLVCYCCIETRALFESFLVRDYEGKSCIVSPECRNGTSGDAK